MNAQKRLLIMGRLGKNPELRYTAKQEPVCYFTMASNIDGTDQALWHNVIVWGKQAEACSVNLKKGAPVFVQGQINRREYTNREGEKKTYTEFKADTVGFIHD
jgi:single-strand DNA-binding protein